jgi:hypothetical protein
LGAASGGGWLALSNPAGGCVKGRAGDTPVGATPPWLPNIGQAQGPAPTGRARGLLGRPRGLPLFFSPQTPSRYLDIKRATLYRGPGRASCCGRRSRGGGGGARSPGRHLIAGGPPTGCGGPPPGVGQQRLARRERHHRLGYAPYPIGRGGEVGPLGQAWQETDSGLRRERPWSCPSAPRAGVAPRYTWGGGPAPRAGGAGRLLLSAPAWGGGERPGPRFAPFLFFAAMSVRSKGRAARRAWAISAA